MLKKTCTPTLKIRKAETSDAEALEECMRVAYDTYSSRLGDFVLPPLTVDYEEEIRDYPTWVAELDGQLVGGIILMPEEKYMTLANVAIHPRAQGKGLGRELLEFCENEAQKLGYSEIRLATHIALEENISLYNYLGWSEIERDQHRVNFRKELKGK